jgi:methyl-accepting chemotaxis protein
MAAKIFEIIGLIAILIFVPVFILLLRFLGRSLKRANKSLGARRSEIRGNLSSTIKGLDSAQGQIDALSGMTATVSSGMQSAIGAVDRFLAFVKSNTFQRGIPVALWTMMAVAGITRGLTPVKLKKKKKKPTPVPPPSWEQKRDKE